MSFELRTAVTEFLDRTELTDFREMAAAIAKSISSKDLRAALEDALPGYIATVNQHRRMDNTILNDDKPRQQHAKSAKVRGIAAMHQQALRTLIHVGAGVNKRLGECGYEDLMFAANERREHARRNAAKADKYEELASKLKALRLTTVAELPASDLTGLEAAA